MKFKIGDRVVYRAVDSGNTDLDGWVGTVVYVDSTSAPYTVRFDNFYRDGNTDERCWSRGDVRGHDWFCHEENLTPVGVRRRVKRTRGGKTTATPVESEQEREGPSHIKQEEFDMAKGIKGHEWTAAEDAVIREMLEGGSSVVDICDRLGVDMVTMKNRLYALQKADPTFPRCMRTGRPSASEPQTSDVPCGRDVAADGGGDVATCGSGDVPTGKLGELERVLADQLAAVTKERDSLQRELDEVRMENAELAEEIGELTRAQVRLLARLDAAHKSLAEHEGEVRELARQLTEVREERDALLEEKECYAEEFADGVAYYKRQVAEMEKVVSAQIGETERARLEHRRLAAEVCEANRVVVALVGRYVVPKEVCV